MLFLLFQVHVRNTNLLKIKYSIIKCPRIVPSKGFGGSGWPLLNSLIRRAKQGIYILKNFTGYTEVQPGLKITAWNNTPQRKQGKKNLFHNLKIRVNIASWLEGEKIENKETKDTLTKSLVEACGLEPGKQKAEWIKSSPSRGYGNYWPNSCGKWRRNKRQKWLQGLKQ